MAVKDIRGAGGTMPDPTKEEEKPGVKGEKDPVDDMERSYYRGERIRLFKKGAGIEDEKTAVAVSPKSEEKFQLNVGDIFKSQGDTVNTLLTKITEMMSSSQAASQNTELVRVREELTELKKELTGGDPMAGLMHSFEIQDQLAERLKKSLGLQGLSGGAISSVANLDAMIALKKIEIDMEESRRQHEDQMAHTKHQWDIDAKQWEKTFQLEVMKFNRDGERREDLMGTLAKGVAAFVDGKMGQVGAAERVAAQPKPAMQAKPLAEAPSSFVCEECGAAISIKPGDAKGVCGECTAEYDLTGAAAGQPI